MTAHQLGQRWFAVFLETVRAHQAAAELRDAASAGDLRRWTKALTDVVVSTFAPMGWKGAAKGHRSGLLPEARQEYLSLDAVAFRAPDSSPSGVVRWRFPVAAFELENRKDDDGVAYSLWKVLCVRAALRVVFCYRRDSEQGRAVTEHLAEQVVRSMDLPTRADLDGETLVVVGSRSEAASFPYGFFKDWTLDLNTSRFRRP